MVLPCSNLNLNLYRIFYTVAKTKSFSESSKELHISQPAISKHIQNLEYELNTLLFYRTNRGIELTPEAKELLFYIEKAWNFIMLGEKNLVESKELTKGEIAIGVPTYISIYFLNDIVKEFRKEYPNISMRMLNSSQEKMLELLHQYNLDMMIIPKNIELDKEYRSLPLYKDKYCFVCLKEEKEYKKMRLEDIAHLPLLLPEKTSPQRKELDGLANELGVVLDPTMELATNEMMVNYVKEDLGIGYMLEQVAKKQKDLEIIEIEEELPKEVIVLVYNEETLPPAGKKFIEVISKKNTIK